MRARFLSMICLGIMATLPASANTFFQVPINSIANAEMATFYQSPPTGDVILGGIPFHIESQGPNLFFTEDDGMGSGNPSTGTLNTHIESPVTAYVLITGTNEHPSFAGKKVGRVVFDYANNDQTAFTLTVGETIRDWCTAPELVITTTTSPNVSVAWSGTTQAYWSYREGVITLLTIPLNPQSALTGITLIDDSMTSTGGRPPGLFFNGVTIEAIATTYSIPATADIYLAGQPAGTVITDSIFGTSDSTSSQAAFEVTDMALYPSSALTFAADGYAIFTGGGSSTPPDGERGYLTAYNPISGVGTLNGEVRNQVLPVPFAFSGHSNIPLAALIGVFTADDVPVMGTASILPPSLDYGQIGFDFQTISPELRQVFFIGDGKTSSGYNQQFWYRREQRIFTWESMMARGRTPIMLADSQWLSRQFPKKISPALLSLKIGRG